jgi:outer membrane lipoprotein-sorting protein
LNFDYLAISGAKAQYKGSGKIKGDQAGYSFIMTVIDGALNGTGTDKIRLKIFNKNTGIVIYDSQPGASDAADPTTVVGSGSTVVIVNPNVIATATKTVPENVITPQLFEVKALPNPTSDKFVLQVKTSNKEPIHIHVMDITGRKLKEMKVGPYETVTFGNEFIQGIYLVEIIQGKNHKVIKLEKL